MKEIQNIQEILENIENNIENIIDMDLDYEQYNQVISYLNEKNIEIDLGEEITLIKDMDIDVKKNDLLSIYLKEIAQYSRLNIEEEKELFKIYQQTHSKEVKNKIINSNLRLVISVAKKYSNCLNSTDSMMDLISAGNEGLVESVERFDVNRGFKFSTYSVWWIKQSILKYLYNYLDPIRLPVNYRQKLMHLKKYISEYEKCNNSKPSEDQIAKELSCTKEQVALMLIGIENRTLYSLNEPINCDSSETYEDFVASEHNVEEEVNQKVEMFELLEMLQECLNAKEFLIIKQRFGLFGTTPLTLEEIGKENNLTKERVRQIEHKTLHKIRKRYNERYGGNF